MSRIRQQLQKAASIEHFNDTLNLHKHATLEDVELVEARNGRRCKNCRAWGPLANADGTARAPRTVNACKFVRQSGGRIVPSKQFGARTKPGMSCQNFVAKGKPYVKPKPLVDLDQV